MTFDDPIERRGTNSTKWDRMEEIYGVPAKDGLSMWVADMDFRAPEIVQNKVREIAELGIFGYTNYDAEYTAAIQWWMRERHGWAIEPSWIFTTTGLVNAVGLCLDVYTKPDDGVVIFTPVYHSFARVIKTAGRAVVECPLVEIDGRYEMDFDAYDKQMTGCETMVMLCSPHNPGGRVWTQDELQGLADFCKRHDLVLVSDEIHHDLVFAGHKHVPMPLADPSIIDRLVMLTAPSKTFNVAGLHTGNVIIQDPELRSKFAARMNALSLAGNSVGQAAALAAYSPEGAAWVDELMIYLDGNRQMFDAAIADIPGLTSMTLDATFLSWVDFSGTGMDRAEFTRRVEQEAKIAVNHGTTFGSGGETFLRFNIGTQRSRIAEACDRLRNAFSDLQ